MPIGVEIRGHGNRHLEDVAYHTRSHRAVNSGGAIVRCGGDERYEVDVG